jgi:hypothetical protein
MIAAFSMCDHQKQHLEGREKNYRKLAAFHSKLCAIKERKRFLWKAIWIPEGSGIG